MKELIKKLNESGAKIVFGLESQGHISTIEQIIDDMSGNIEIDGELKYVDMTYDKHTWDRIGKEIGWCPLTAALHYFRYINDKE